MKQCPVPFNRLLKTCQPHGPLAGRQETLPQAPCGLARGHRPGPAVRMQHARPAPGGRWPRVTRVETALVALSRAGGEPQGVSLSARSGTPSFLRIGKIAPPGRRPGCCFSTLSELQRVSAISAVRKMRPPAVARTPCGPDRLPGQLVRPRGSTRLTCHDPCRRISASPYPLSGLIEEKQVFCPEAGFEPLARGQFPSVVHKGCQQPCGPGGAGVDQRIRTEMLNDLDHPFQ